MNNHGLIQYFHALILMNSIFNKNIVPTWITLIFCCFQLSFCSFVVHAQNNKYIFDHLDANDGFMTVFEDAIVQDHDGYIWLNTWEGLFRYDGFRFKPYKYLENDSIEMGSSALLSDQSGQLWVGTHENGLLKYNKEHDRFVPQSLEVGGYSISYLINDSKGNIWIGTNGGGVKLIHSSGDSVQHFAFNDPNNSKSLRGEKVRCIYEDRTGTIWVGTGNRFESMVMGGLNMYQAKQNSFTSFTYQPQQYNGIRPNRVSTIYENTSGKLLIGTAPDGLFVFDPKKNDKWARGLPHSDGKADDILGTGTIRFIHEHKATNTLWIGVFGKGIIQMDLNNGNTHHITPDPNDRFALSHSHVWTIFEDRQGLLWLSLIHI